LTARGGVGSEPKSWREVGVEGRRLRRLIVSKELREKKWNIPWIGERNEMELHRVHAEFS